MRLEKDSKQRIKDKNMTMGMKKIEKIERQVNKSYQE